MATRLVKIPAARGRLREAAEQIQLATGRRIEIIRGTLLMPPAPPVHHMAALNDLRHLLDDRLPEGLGDFENVAVPLPGDPDDYAVPSLLVCRTAVLAAEPQEWLLPGEDAELAVEVTSPSERPVGVADKIAWYAEARVPRLLYLFPAKGSWSLHSRPSDEGYRTVSYGKYGDAVPLPDELGGELPTGDLPRYEA
ncbi:Uma2 family endonuclease [Streptomyces orinoci]|uniref:Uma2 family endonuclease n=1 Tax=Streptomyces orinoci TaxID=67339 RepID=A0ABV3JQK1_STRON|nr:Uma2 family endonuclease [Streptomyces orinoci]